MEIGWLDGVVWSVVVGEKCGKWLNESEHGVFWLVGDVDSWLVDRSFKCVVWWDG